jgi:hypothetical protein
MPKHQNKNIEKGIQTKERIKASNNAQTRMVLTGFKCCSKSYGFYGYCG